MAERALAPACERLEQIRRFLDEHAAEITGWPFGHLTFDWSPGDVKYKLTEAGKIGAKNGDVP